MLLKIISSALLLLLCLGIVLGTPPLPHLGDLNGKLQDLDMQGDLVHLAGESENNGSQQTRRLEVTLPGLGTARGRVMHSYHGREMYAFQSMPFAVPPVGKRRFKSSELWDNSTRPWPTEEDEDFYDATYLRARCPQGSYILPEIGGREDCLTLSVYTPQNPDSVQEALPVMYWIYGGGYMSGDAFFYVPSKLLDHDALVVVIQYRLGVLGFLASRTPDNPGNMGLSDQITGLRWVQKHISYFGGDPDKVTVFGQSAGGSSSSWMQITPATQATAAANNGRQLLHRVIPQSGSALEHWTLDNDPEGSFKETAERTGCVADTVAESIECMRGRSVENITKAGNQMSSSDHHQGLLGFRGVTPVIQTPLIDQDEVEVIIPKNPLQSLEDGEYLKIPTMGGAVRDEGSFVAALIYDSFIKYHHLENDTEFMREEAIPLLLKGFGYEDKTDGLSSTMEIAYMPEDVEMGNWTSMVGGFTDMCGVLFLKAGIWNVAHKIYNSDASVPFYSYSFEFESDDSIFDWANAGRTPPVDGGICHADELIYLFSIPGDFDERELRNMHRMTTLWTNFARHGNPTPEEEDNWKELGIDEWKPFNPTDLNFMLMSDEFTLEHDFVKRWNYHKNSSIPGYPTKSPAPQVTKSGRKFVSRKEYDEALRQKKGFSAATGVLVSLLGCSLLIIVLLGRKLRSS